jgi:hypothetical protein
MRVFEESVKSRRVDKARAGRLTLAQLHGNRDEVTAVLHEIALCGDRRALLRVALVLAGSVGAEVTARYGRTKGVGLIEQAVTWNDAEYDSADDDF